MAVLVLGATGKQGREVVYECLQQHLEVWAMCRNTESSVSKTLAEKGAKLVQGDFHVKNDLERAFNVSKAHMLFFLSIERVGMLPWQAGKHAKSEIWTAKMIFDIAEQNRVQYVVMSSVAGADSNYAKKHLPNFQAKANIEKYLKTKLMLYTILRPVNLLESFTDPQLGSLDPTAGRVVGMPYDEKLKIWWISCRDLGRISGFCFKSFAMGENADKSEGDRVQVRNQTINCASVNVSAAEITSTFGKVYGLKTPRYKAIAPKFMLQIGLLPDFGRMQKMWKETGYPITQADIELLEKIAPNMYSVEDFLQSIVLN